jgi:hypothetical protein
MEEPRGLPLRVDPSAESANPEEPPFVAPPGGAPVYHGFPILDDVDVDGFTLGMITDWEAEPSSYGDAFVVAPDGSRAGLDWEVMKGRRCEAVCEVTTDRWGVWYVRFPHAMDSRDSARRNLAYVLPDLRARWQEWRLRSEN